MKFTWRLLAGCSLFLLGILLLVFTSTLLRPFQTESFLLTPGNIVSLVFFLSSIGLLLGGFAIAIGDAQNATRREASP